MIKTVLVTGAGGYVGAMLVPELLKEGYAVKALDLYLYGEEVLDDVREKANLKGIKGDIRDKSLLEKELRGVDAVIHLACISNDPSFELDPELGKSINFDAFTPLVEISKKSGVQRFIYASSSSVYGVKEEENVTEDLELEHLTDYSKYKALCEEVLLEYQSPEFCVLIARPATVCGYSKRQRLDLSVNILTNHAFNNRVIKVFGGEQKRPNIHIKDMIRFYLESLKWPSEKINGKTYNVGYENLKMNDIAAKVKSIVGEDVKIENTPTDDNRSYHISSEKIKRELGFEPKFTVSDAVEDLIQAFEEGKLPDSMSDDKYFNIKRMQKVNLK